MEGRCRELTGEEVIHELVACCPGRMMDMHYIHDGPVRVVLLSVRYTDDGGVVLHYEDDRDLSLEKSVVPSQVAEGRTDALGGVEFTIDVGEQSECFVIVSAHSVSDFYREGTDDMQLAGCGIPLALLTMSSIAFAVMIHVLV